MRKIASLLLGLFLVFGMATAASAQEVRIKTSVPEYHTVTVEASGGRIIADNQFCGSTVQVPRQQAQVWRIVPNKGKTLSALYYNGQNVTSQMNGTTFAAPPLTDDAVLEAVFVDSPPQEEHYDIDGTVTDDGGNPVPGVTVDVGGHTGTTGTDGGFQIEDVPPGTHPVVITDEDGNVIGTGEITVGESGDGDFTVTTDSGGNPVITPGKDTEKIDLTIEVGGDGGVTIKDIKDETSSKPGNCCCCLVLWLLIIIAICIAWIIFIVAKRRKEKNAS